MSIKYQGRVEQQLELFNEEAIDIKKTEPNGKAAFSDPAFASNKTLPVHRWVPWIAGFSSDFVKSVLNTGLDKKGTVLDPFAGVGTTLVEAVLAGYKAIGFEINPYAALACSTKLSAHLIDVTSIKSHILKLKAFFKDNVSSGYIPKSEAPAGFRTRADFYSPSVLYKVLIIQDFISTIGDSVEQNLFKLAFAATMVSYSNYSYEPSLSRRVSSGKAEIIDFPVLETVLSKLGEMIEDITWFQDRLADQQLNSSIINDTFFHYEQYLEPASIDLIVTSPPYLNNYHYNRNTRPQLYWLGYATKPQDLKSLEEANFGKYWQTVRDAKLLDLAFSLPDTDIEERLKRLRLTNAEKKMYGGNGWANYAASYFNDCYKLASGIKYCLKSGGKAFVVIGNSILQGLTIPTDYYFGQIAASIGLELIDIHIPRATRIGSSIIQSSVRVAKAKDSHRLYEAVVELRKR